jgi:hypothetical protein
MVQIFKENGEVVMCVGSSCRLQNNSIFQISDLAVAVATLPGDKQQIPVDIGDLINRFPAFYGGDNGGDNHRNSNYSNSNNNNNKNNIPNENENNNNNNNNNTQSPHTTSTHSTHSSCLCRDDLLLHYRLIGLGTAPLLQLPPVLASSVYTGSTTNGLNADNNNNNNNGNICYSKNNNLGATRPDPNLRHLKLSALLEGIHMGRVYLVNSLQVGAFLAVSCLSLALWPLVACAVPLSVPPSLPPPIALLFLFLYIPLLSFSILFGPGPDGVMKATPRKNLKVKPEKKINTSILDCFKNKNETKEKEIVIGENEMYSESELFLQRQQRERKVKDEARFFRYLLVRCIYVAFSLFITGWLACGGIFSIHGPSPKGIHYHDYER